MSQIQPTEPKYPYKPIGTLLALESALGVPLTSLLSTASKANGLYRTVKAEPKSDGTLRQTFDAFPELKSIQTLINNRLLKRVIFPQYLTGSLKGRDYRANAKLHTGAAIVICEDVTNFFPSVSEKIVNRIWVRFFGFSPEIGDLLTKLTTKDGCLPQGSVTSSYLANLAFFSDEPKLYARLECRGLRYSRYVDDITVSSTTELNKYELSEVISDIYTMLGKNGFKAKRRKHEIKRRNGQMFTTKLLINERVALTPTERAAIRSAVHQLECKLKIATDVAALRADLNSVRGRVDKLKGFHPAEGTALRLRVNALKAQYPELAATPKMLAVVRPTPANESWLKEKVQVAARDDESPPF